MSRRDDLLQRAPLLALADDELAQIAAAVDIPPDPDIATFAPSWHLSLPHVCVASIGAFMFGYHSGVVNAPLLFIARDLGFADSSFAQGWVVSICLVGALLGCILSGPIADTLGRRRSAQLSAIPIIIGASLSALAPSLGFMVVGRLLVGVGLGIGSPSTALYVSEISPTAFRGTFGALCQIAACLGLLGALVAGLPVAVIAGWWRICFWIAVVPAALVVLGMEFCSESPRWLFKQSRWSEAELAIKRLWGTSNLKAAVADLVRTENEKGVEQASYAELFSRQYVKVVLTGASIFAFQQFAGINAVFYFSSTLFRNAGVTSELLASVSVGVVNLVASCIAAALMDRLGRKTLLMWSFFGMSLGMAIQAFGAVVPILARAQSYISLCGTLFFVFMFAVGVGPVPPALLPEIFPNRIRAKAMAFCMGVHWMGSCLVGLMFLPLLERFGPSFVCTSFAVVCLFGVVFVRECVIETKGKSLEEIEALLLKDYLNPKETVSSSGRYLQSLR